MANDYYNFDRIIKNLYPNEPQAKSAITQYFEKILYGSQPKFDFNIYKKYIKYFRYLFEEIDYPLTQDDYNYTVRERGCKKEGIIPIIEIPDIDKNDFVISHESYLEYKNELQKKLTDRKYKNVETGDLSSFLNDKKLEPNTETVRICSLGLWRCKEINHSLKYGKNREYNCKLIYPAEIEEVLTGNQQRPRTMMLSVNSEIQSTPLLRPVSQPISYPADTSLPIYPAQITPRPVFVSQPAPKSIPQPMFVSQPAPKPTPPSQSASQLPSPLSAQQSVKVSEKDLGTYITFLDEKAKKVSDNQRIFLIKSYVESLLAVKRIVINSDLSGMNTKQKIDWFLKNKSLYFLFEVNHKKDLQDFPSDDNKSCAYQKNALEEWAFLEEKLKKWGIRRTEIKEGVTVVQKSWLSKGWAVKNTKKRTTSKLSEDFLVYGVIQHGIEIDDKKLRMPIVNVMAYKK